MEAVYLTFILVLAIFLGFELISKVPATLHTPLMSGANAISGITLVGRPHIRRRRQRRNGHDPRHPGRDLRLHQRGRRLHGHQPHAVHVQEEGR